MVRVLTILLALGLLSGCALTQERVRVEYRDVVKPVLTCPAPPTITRPHLPIDDLTEEDKKNPDKVAKAYKATVKVLQGYGIQLETALKKYDDISKKYEALRSRVNELFPEGVKLEK